MQSPLISINSPVGSPNNSSKTNNINKIDDIKIQKKPIKKKDEYIKANNDCDELKIIISIAIPVTLATIARIIIYNTDTAFLGHLGTDELAGAALASTIAQFLYTFIFAPAYGLNSLCSQAIGAGNPELCGNWLQLSIVISLIACIPTAFIFIYVSPILGLLETDSNVLHWAGMFGKIASIYLPPTAIYMAIRQYFQAMQLVIPATIVSWISVGINIGMNKLLIYGININIGNFNINWNGFGFIGSPLATSFSIFFQLFLFIFYTIIIKKYPCKKNMWNGFTKKSFKKSRIKEFFKVIGPMTIGDASESWGYQVVTLSTATLPPADVASINVVFSIWGLLWSIFWGIGLATIIRAGKTIGNGDIPGIKRVIKLSLILCFLINGPISILCYFFRNNLAKIFTTDEDVLQLLNDAIPILAMLYFVAGLGWPAVAVMEGMSRNTAKALVYSTTCWLLYVPLAIYLALYSSLKNKMSPVCLIWWTALGVEILRVILIYIVLYKTDWEKEAINAKKRSEMLLNIDKNEIKKIKNSSHSNNDKIVKLLNSSYSKEEISEEKQLKEEWRSQQKNTAVSLHEYDHQDTT